MSQELGSQTFSEPQLALPESQGVNPELLQPPTFPFSQEQHQEHNDFSINPAQGEQQTSQQDPALPQHAHHHAAHPAAIGNYLPPQGVATAAHNIVHHTTDSIGFPSGAPSSFTPCLSIQPQSHTAPPTHQHDFIPSHPVPLHMKHDPEHYASIQLPPPQGFASSKGYRHSLPPQQHPSIQKLEHKGSKASRRGPMDEMRQLVRILVKFVPRSAEVLNTSLDNGGGNRVSEEQIKNYLRKTLGEEAPQPEWGLPEGWGAYLSELLCWALDRPITREQAMSCARRQQGRSWEIVESAVRDLDIYSYAWPVPLTLAGIRAAQENPGMPSPGSGFLAPTHSRRHRSNAAHLAAKRTLPEEYQGGGIGNGVRKSARRDERPLSRVDQDEDEFAKYTAQDCLAEALKFVQAGSTKMQNRGPRDSSESFESLWSLLASIMAARPHPLLAGMPPHIGHLGSMPVGMGMGALGVPGLEGIAGAGSLALPGIQGSLPIGGDLSNMSMMHMGSMGMNMAALGMGSMGMTTLGGSLAGIPGTQGPAAGAMAGMQGSAPGAMLVMQGGQMSGVGAMPGSSGSIATHAPIPPPNVGPSDAMPILQSNPNQGATQTQLPPSKEEGEGHAAGKPLEASPVMSTGMVHAPAPVKQDGFQQVHAHPSSNGRVAGMPPLQSQDALHKLHSGVSPSTAFNPVSNSGHSEQARKQQRWGYQGRGSRGNGEDASAQDEPFRDQLSVLALAASEQRRQDMMEGGNKGPGGPQGNGAAAGQPQQQNPLSDVNLFAAGRANVLAASAAPQRTHGSLQAVEGAQAQQLRGQLMQHMQ